MTYFKVPKCMQDKPCYKPNTVKRIPNGYYLIADELLTESECRRLNAPIEKLEKVTIKKTDTFRMFGTRFEAREE